MGKLFTQIFPHLLCGRIFSSLNSLPDPPQRLVGCMNRHMQGAVAETDFYIMYTTCFQLSFYGWKRLSCSHTFAFNRENR